MDSQNLLSGESIGIYLRRFVEGWIRFLWHRRKNIIVYGVGIAALSVGIALITPKKYMTTASILPTKPASPVSSMLAQLGSFGLNLGGASTTSMAYYYPKIIDSQWVLRRTLETPFRGSTVEQILYDDPKGWASLKPNELELARQKLVFKLRQALMIGVDESTSMTTVQILSKDSELDAFIINTVLKNLETYFQQSFRTEAKNKLDMIEIRIDQVSDSLHLAENALTDFRERNQSITSPNLQMKLSRLQRDVTINQEVFLELKKQEELTKLEVLGSTPVVNVLDEAIIKMVPNAPSRKVIAISIFIGGMVLLSLVLRGIEQHWYTEIRRYFRDLLADENAEASSDKKKSRSGRKDPSQ